MTTQTPLQKELEKACSAADFVGFEFAKQEATIFLEITEQAVRDMDLSSDPKHLAEVYGKYQGYTDAMRLVMSRTTADQALSSSKEISRDKDATVYQDCHGRVQRAYGVGWGAGYERGVIKDNPDYPRYEAAHDKVETCWSKIVDDAALTVYEKSVSEARDAALKLIEPPDLVQKE